MHSLVAKIRQNINNKIKQTPFTALYAKVVGQRSLLVTPGYSDINTVAFFTIFRQENLMVNCKNYNLFGKAIKYNNGNFPHKG